jgi:hypothetical protein
MGEIGRPALDGPDVVFTLDSPRRNAIEMFDLATGARRILRSTYSGLALLYPSLLDGRLLYERVNRCSQQLLIGPLNASRNERTLLRVPSTVQRDPGFERGYEHAYNTASLCPDRGAGPGSPTRLGPTALSRSAAYVTEIPSNPDHARIIALPR